MFSEVMNALFFPQEKKLKITKCFKQQCGIEKNSPESLGTNDFQFYTEKSFPS